LSTVALETKRPLLEVKDLRTQFFTQDGVVKAVNGVSFTLAEGEALGLVGESGCGKSVSALSLMRLIPQPPGRIVSGEVNFDGRDLLKLKEDDMRKVRGNDIAMIFQDPMTSLNPVLTIGRQISEALELHKGMDRSQARKRTIELLELVGIPSARSRVDDYPHQFSGGMRQRVMIAMALSCEPKLLLADEPTTALDVTIQAQILDLIKRLREELGMANSMIAHDQGVVDGIADRMNERNRFTASVSASVQQQNAATGEISQNVASAAQGTKEIVAVLGEVAGAATETRGSAETVLAASEAVEQAASNLRSEVEDFLQKVAV